jgi:site-specific recombinase XerD
LSDALEREDVRDVSYMTRSSMRAFFAGLQQRVQRGEITESTVAAYDRTCRTFCAFCVHESWLAKDPMRTRPPVKAPRTTPDTFEMSEIQAMLGTCDQTPIGMRDRAIMLLMLDTGMRAGEVVHLTDDCVEMTSDRGKVLVRAAGSKSQRDRSVPFWSATREALCDWYMVRPQESEAVFVASDGIGLTVEPLTTSGLNQLMRRHARRVGLSDKRRLCHIWRHTFACFYVRRGGDLETLRRMLGHASLDVTRMYLSFRDRDIAQKHFELSPVRQLFESDSE